MTDLMIGEARDVGMMTDALETCAYFADRVRCPGCYLDGHGACTKRLMLDAVATMKAQQTLLNDLRKHNDFLTERLRGVSGV